MTCGRGKKDRHMYMTKYMPDHFGAHGFKRPQSIIKDDKIINVGNLEEKFPGKNAINLTEAGFDKLLGGGKIATKIKVTVNSASEKAIAKIQDKGGEVVLPEEKIIEQEVVEEEKKS